MKPFINMIVICALGAATVATPAIASESQPPKRISIAAIETVFAVQRDHEAIDPEFVKKRVIEAFLDAPVMIAIAECESEFKHYRQDGTLNVNRLIAGGKRVSSASGVFQVLYLKHYSAWSKDPQTDITTVDGNIAFARQMYEASGTAPWSESSGCWTPKIRKYEKLVEANATS